MSGIAGIVSFDASHPEPAQIAAMMARLARRGPDGSHTLVDRHLALGHTLLATTPEALVEKLPLTDDASGCTITADARLDNRDELMTSLGLGAETRTIGDGELILRAYLKYDEDCPAHLLGDFAFAIWDPRAARLLCARDPIGMRQLTYHQVAGRRFAFATEPGAILALPDGAFPLNHDRVGDYLGNMEGADLSATFFRGISRLPPAHVLIVDREGLVLRRYWELVPQPILELPSDEAYADAFRTVFTTAVRSRLRSAGPVGAMVSGGINSNAVAAVAADLLASEGRGPLPTFSAVGPDPDACPETRAIVSAIASPAFAPTTIDHSALGADRDRLSRDTAQSDEPFDASMVLLRAVYLSAHRAGIKVVLDGVGGDLAVSSDFHVGFLLRAGRFRQAVREARGERHFWGPEAPALRGLIAAGWQAFAPMPLRALRFWRGRRSVDRQFSREAKARAPYLDVGRALDRRRRVQARDLDHDRLDAHTRVRPLVHPHLVVGRERYDRVAASFGVEPRDPFLDLRVIRFCLSLPRDQLQRDGWPKWILRRAMSGIVPYAVAWRRGKEHLGPDFSEAVSLEPRETDHGDAQPIDSPTLTERYEKSYLSNWFAYMLGTGWASGTVTKEGFQDDDR